jgi:RNA polymerase sigma-70 factor, ECF subfamily
MESFETYRRLLFFIAYRMLGSAMEAEDMVQETYLRYQAVAPESIRSLKPFLTTIITRLCLDQLKAVRSQREQYIGPWLPEPLQTEGVEPPESDSLSMAFLVLLESLSPPERAVFLLREVFEYDYDEIARMLDKEEAACRQLFSRARQHITDHRPRFTSTPEQQQRILGSFMQAVSQGDVQGLTALLAQDAVWYSDGGGKVRAATRPVQGAAAIAALLMNIQSRIPADFHMEVMPINGVLSLAMWSGDQPFGVMTFTLDEAHIQAIYFVVNPDKLAHLGDGILSPEPDTTDD